MMSTLVSSENFNENLCRQGIVSIIEVLNVAPHHFLMTFEAPFIASNVRAGQFVHILPRSSSHQDPFLRRAFSVMSITKSRVQILFRSQGRGTQWLSKVCPGDHLDVLGPLGRPFDLSPFHVKQIPAPIPILLGGGVGVPPLIFLGETLRNMGHSPVAFVGARTASDVIGKAEWKQFNIEINVATDDGSEGHTGRVTDLLQQELETHAKAVIYACGPLPMLRTVAQIAAQREVQCQVSMEENMPCGIGVCNGCVLAMKEPDTSNHSAYNSYRRICVEGPAVWSDEIDWGKI